MNSHEMTIGSQTLAGSMSSRRSPPIPDTRPPSRSQSLATGPSMRDCCLPHPSGSSSSRSSSASLEHSSFAPDGDAHRFWKRWPSATDTSAASSPAAPGRDSGCAILEPFAVDVAAGQTEAAAEALFTEFGSLSRVLAAGKDAQARVLGEQHRIMDCLSLVREAMLHALETDISGSPLLNNTEAVAGYLHVAMAHELREHVRVLFLDSRHCLIRDETMSSGTVASAELHPREVMKRALELGATGLILAHNHPAGAPSHHAMTSGRHGR